MNDCYKFMYDIKRTKNYDSNDQIFLGIAVVSIVAIEVRNYSFYTTRILN